ncbi:MAG: response regulator [Marinilabiliales bacterium]|nr:MAG: response regulator [Marinilabiliales bacterium]
MVITITSNKKEIYNWKDKNILVVEDELMCYRLIELTLAPTKAKLLRAENGERAIEICNDNEDIDIVLMDIQLPQLSGFEATERIRTIRPELPIVAQTAYAMSTQKARCFEAGCTDYITKPYDGKKLLDIIHKHINHSSR